MKRSLNPILCCFYTLAGLFLSVGTIQYPSISMLWVIAVVGFTLFAMGAFFRTFICYAGFLLLGVFVVVWHALGLQKHWIPDVFLGRDIVLNGQVDSLPLVSENVVRFKCVVTEAEHPELRDTLLWLSWYHAPSIEPGEQWQLTVRLKHPRGSLSDGAFDREAWAAREGIAAVGYVRQGAFQGRGSSGWHVIRDKVRASLRTWLLTYTSETSGAVLVALLLGDKSLISQALWDTFNATGTTHLVVISGLHIGLMTLLGFWLIRSLAFLGLIPLSVWPAPKMAALFSVLLAGCYAMVAGFGIPVQRALVMAGCAQLAPICGFRPRPLTLFLAALVVVVVLEPLALVSHGFWYSFSAVAVLLYGFCGRIDAPRPASMAYRWFKTQSIIFLMLCPMLMFNHQPVSVLSPFINLIAVPLIGFVVVPFTFIAVMVHPLSSVVSQGVLAGLDYLLTGGVSALHCLAWLGWTLPLQSCDWSVVGLATLSIWVLFSSAALGLRKLALFLVLPWCFPVKKMPDMGEAFVAVLDVGQGLSVLIKTHRHALLYDTAGLTNSQFSPAGRIVLPYLHRHQVTTLDRIMISHGDSDHAGGLNVIHRFFPEADVFCGSPVDAFDAPVSPCLPGQSWVWDQVAFEVLAGSEGAKSNHRSCVLKISASGQSLLLTGDIDARTEQKLIKQGMELSSSVMLLPHHGSQYSGSDAFLEAVAPAAVMVSAGYNNRFRHPSHQAVARVRAVGAHLYNTAESGTLYFSLGKGGHSGDAAPGIMSYRDGYGHYWRR